MFYHNMQAIQPGSMLSVFVLLYCFQTAMRASQAAGPLAAWVKANVQYSIVLEKIEPLETEQAHLQK